MNRNNSVDGVVIGEAQLKQWLRSNAINLSVSDVQNRNVISDNNNSNHKKCSSGKFLGLNRKSLDEENSYERTNIKGKHYKVLNALKGLDVRKPVFEINNQIIGENFETKAIKEENEIDQNFAKPTVFSFAGSQRACSLADSQQTACFGESHTERDVSYNNTDDASLNRTDSMIKVADREKSDFLKKYRGIVSTDQAFFDVPEDIMSRVIDYVVENVPDNLEKDNGARIFVEYSDGVARIKDCVNFLDVKITHDSISSTQIIKGVLPPEKKDGKIAVTRDNIVMTRKLHKS